MLYVVMAAEKKFNETHLKLIWDCKSIVHVKEFEVKAAIDLLEEENFLNGKIFNLCTRQYYGNNS